MSVFPELVSCRDDIARGSWRIETGSARRGDASCDLGERILRVPRGSDPSARVVRAHELVHARVSPGGVARVPAGVSVRALECAEEYRVNTILTRLGFAVAELSDGSERRGGERLAREGDWDEVLCFWLAVLGTGAERPFLAGVRSQVPAWAPALRAVRSRVGTMIRGVSIERLGVTSLNADGLPVGYAEVTVPIARLVSGLLSRPPAEGPVGLQRFKEQLRRAPRGLGPTGRFAPLRVSPSRSQRRRAAPGASGWRPSAEGVSLRYPNRLLLDDQRRALGRRARHASGVVVVDQSGSMELDVAALERLVSRAPGSWVLGYSHRPGDDGSTPNAWVLASPRQRVAVPPRGNVGNGVDGPALEWALAHRRGAEPVVWVTDGQVTDSNDCASTELAMACARLVRTRRIRLARDLDDATRILRGWPPRRAAETFGRVGRALQTSKSFGPGEKRALA